MYSSYDEEEDDMASIKEWQEAFSEQSDDEDAYDDDHISKNIPNNAPSSQSQQSKLDSVRPDEKETSKFSALQRNGLVQRGTNLHFGDHLSVYCHSISSAQMLSISTSCTGNLDQPTLVSNELNVVKMILEALLGAENDLFSISKPQEKGERLKHLRKYCFRLTYVAHRIALKSVRPKALTTMLHWFAAQASSALILRKFIHEAMLISGGASKNSVFEIKG